MYIYIYIYIFMYRYKSLSSKFRKLKLLELTVPGPPGYWEDTSQNKPNKVQGWTNLPEAIPTRTQ